MSRSSEGQCHNAACTWKGIDLSNDMWEYDANWLTNEKVIRGNKTLTQRPRPLGFHRSISQFLSPKIRLINCILILEKILY